VTWRLRPVACLEDGAGDGNRTHVSSLGSYSSTIELRPRGVGASLGGAARQRNASGHPMTNVPAAPPTTGRRKKKGRPKAAPLQTCLAADQNAPLKLTKNVMSRAPFCAVVEVTPKLLCRPHTPVRAPSTTVA